MKLSKTQLVSLILISILGSTIVTLYLAPILGLDVGDVSTFYLDRGPRYEYSYIVGVWNSTHYYAMNGTTGQREWLSSSGSTVIQNAIDNGGGGKVFIRNGRYTCSSAITGRNNTYLEGETRGCWNDYDTGVVLDYTGGVTTAFLDFRNVCDFGLSNLKLINTGSATRGIYTGSLVLANKPKMIKMEYLTVNGFSYGIQGYTYPPDDSILTEVFVNGSTSIGIDFLSSQVLMLRGGVSVSSTGVRIYRTTSADPNAAMQFYSTVFSGCDIAVDLMGNQTLHQVGFFGCWIEGCDTMILRTTAAQNGVNLGYVLFDNCEMTTSAGATAIFDLRHGGNIFVEVNGGELYPVTDGTEIFCDGSQYIRLWKIIGWDRIAFNGTVHGMDVKHIYLLNDANGYATGVTGTGWTGVWQDTECLFDGRDVVNATVFYRWNPNSTGNGGVSLYHSGRFGISEASGAQRYDSVDVTAFVRENASRYGDIAIQVHGDGSDDPILKQVILGVEW